MHDHWLEFSQVAAAHLLAVASPGPDFAIILRQSLLYGRRTATWTSVGVGAGILLHVAYSLLGIGLILKSSPLAFAAVKYAGAAYLAWLGVQALRTRRRPVEATAPAALMDQPTARTAWITGFLTNALNPKVTLFFVALFVTVISPQTPKWVQVGYGVWMAVATTAWFCLVAAVFTRAKVRAAFLRHGHWVDRALGVVFIAFALSLVLASMR
ncbi:MAG: LysE family transporter [Undibacterium sp.]|nr:LysE family transporter [Opitutaceae bacterium]